MSFSRWPRAPGPCPPGRATAASGLTLAALASQMLLSASCRRASFSYSFRPSFFPLCSSAAKRAAGRRPSAPRWPPIFCFRAKVSPFPTPPRPSRWLCPLGRSRHRLCAASAFRGALRRDVEAAAAQAHATKTERLKKLYLEEMTHRTKNDLQFIASMLRNPSGTRARRGTCEGVAARGREPRRGGEPSLCAAAARRPVRRLDEAAHRRSLRQSSAGARRRAADRAAHGTQLADHVRRRINGKQTFYNRNVHIEPTNICVYNCKFCSYSNHQSPESWELTIDEMVRTVEELGNEITEVHIVGAVHPGRDIHYYAGSLKRVREARPSIHIKAFTAIEIEYMVRKAEMSLEQGLQLLKDSGLDSIPGGGAEIFDEKIREVICGQKSTSEAWLKVHETAHRLGIPSNATILYGHIEQYEHRINHLFRSTRFAGSHSRF